VTSAIDHGRLAATLAEQDHVISRQQALDCGLTQDAVTHRIRSGGPWQRLFPGIYLAHTGSLTVSQKEMAALLHAGPGSVLTGPAALRLLGMTSAEPDHFDVLVPAHRRPESVAFVAIHRTARMPPSAEQSGRSCARPTRALADTARAMTDLSEVRALIAGAIQRGDSSLEELASELREGGRPGSALLRKVLAEAEGGVRSVADAELRDLVKRARLPTPIFNARLHTAEGTFIAQADAWWSDAGVAVEVDSGEWHLKPVDWERDMRRHNVMTSHGTLVLHFSPAQIRNQPDMVVTTVTDALRAGRGRPALPITAQPAA
jgi:very-short-patch-repair endonuclease